MSLVIRKYNAVNGWPIWLSLDDTSGLEVDITDVDSIMNKAIKDNENLITNNPNDIKILCQEIKDHVTECLPLTGCAVVIYVDKMFVVSGSGTLSEPSVAFKEMLFLLNVAPHV